jgi:hypothetical protein
MDGTREIIYESVLYISKKCLKVIIIIIIIITITIHDFKCEGVDSFACLGSFLDNRNKLWTGIHSDTVRVNSTYATPNEISSLKLCPEILN